MGTMTIFAKREGYALPDEVTVNSGRRKRRPSGCKEQTNAIIPSPIVRCIILPPQEEGFPDGNTSGPLVKNHRFTGNRGGAGL